MNICHVAIFTKNLEVMKDFYVKYFQGTSNSGYRNPVKGFSSYFVSFGTGASIEIMTKDEGLFEVERTQICTGFAHIAFDLENHETVDRLTSRLKSDGFKVISDPRVTGDGYYESCVLDPDGNQVELTCAGDAD